MTLSEDAKRQVAIVTDKLLGERHSDGRLFQHGDVLKRSFVRIVRSTDSFRVRDYVMSGRGWSLQYSIMSSSKLTVVSAYFFGDDDQAEQRFEEDLVMLIMAV